MGSETGKNIPYLDGWRGVAIIFVLIGHFSPPIAGHTMRNFGSLGVALFFVLSGFLMGQILFLKGSPLSNFFARRIIRIVPTLWIYITVTYFYARYFSPNLYAASLAELLSAYLFLSTYIPENVSLWSDLWPIGHLWSLNIEEHCYIYLALGTVLISKSKGCLNRKLFLVGSVLVVAMVTYLYIRGLLHSAVASPWKIHTEVASLGLLASAAYVALKKNRPDSWWLNSPLIPTLASAITFILFTPRFYSDSLVALIAPFFATVAINHAEKFPLLIKNILSLKLLRWFGTCSFSLYLWQQPFYLLSHIYNYNYAVCLTGAVLTGVASFYIIEQRSRKFLIRKWENFQRRRLERQAAII